MDALIIRKGYKKLGLALISNPLAPLLFATVLQKLVNEIKTAAPQLLLNLWYLDDGHIAGDARDVRLALNILQEKGPQLRLHLNLSEIRNKINLNF